MASAAWALQQAIHVALTADVALSALLGGTRVYDDVPTRAEFPYVSFAPGEERDWSTGSEEGIEHLVTLNVWSRAGGRKETMAIVSALRAVLHDASLSLIGHRLVNLRHETSDVRRASDGETYHGVVRFRAVSEPIV